MKATITRDGMLIIRAETELEAYALNQWACDTLLPTSMLVDASLDIPDEGKPL